MMMHNVVVLLAAGASRRTSTMKQLYKVDGVHLINVQIKKLLAYGYEVVVVLGHNYENIKKIIESDVKIIYNRNYKEGMFASVKAVFETLEADQYIFCHVDRPIADKVVFTSLINTTTDIAVAFKDKKNAPPIMIKSSMKNILLTTSHTRLDEWIKAQDNVSYVAVEDEKVHYNANTDEELRRYFN